MLPYAPEPLKRLRARLPQALSVVYDHRKIAQGGTRPGQLREHVFDFEDGVRCIISLDLEETVVLHLSFSCLPHTQLSFIDFLNRTEAIPTELWPDTVLLELNRLMTEKALHHVYEVPSTWPVPA